MKGKILASKYARENKVPYLGICLGMQIAIIEFARSVLNLPHANSTEFDPDTTTPCVIFMPEVSYYASIMLFIETFCCLIHFECHTKGSKTHMGGTMRLGSRRTYFDVSSCKAAKL